MSDESRTYSRFCRLEAAEMQAEIKHLRAENERLGRCNEELSKSHAEVINAQNEEIRQLRVDLMAAYSEMSKQFPAKSQICDSQPWIKANGQYCGYMQVNEHGHHVWGKPAEERETQDAREATR